MQSTDQLIQSVGLRKTESRVEILTVFLSSSFALSEKKIQEKVNSTCDRATVYRTLKSFLKKGLIHKVLDDSSTVKYALCSSCDSKNHSHSHIHFKCDACGETFCVEQVNNEKYVLPKGFTKKETHTLITGVCKNCNKSFL